MSTNTPPSSDAESATWPPGAVQDWLSGPDSAVVQHKMRVLGRAGAITVLGVLAQRGPCTRHQVQELAQLEPTVTRDRLTQLRDIGLVALHEHRGPKPATWAINHDGMTRLGAYFIRPAPHPRA
ncbi:hypothetical protein [Allobranchiibius huperziae]|uniref:Chromosome segregation and condensation protein ScpB n=1 Tax=Allobranchiibius huperziae TaxID=1874116 RepID=A0A853DG55_9MICO|nr:hypothetical protein [Allobranchiibius huperziae]NYJ76522.1 chromosome segregation and condensation protein ScpB [Allobranchiibius huperziae]